MVTGFCFPCFFARIIDFNSRDKFLFRNHTVRIDAIQPTSRLKLEAPLCEGENRLAQKSCKVSEYKSAHTKGIFLMLVLGDNQISPHTGSISQGYQKIKMWNDRRYQGTLMRSSESQMQIRA